MSKQAFSYIGEAKTGQEFINYVHGYDFGTVPPTFVVLHNTAIPDATWAPLGGDPKTKWNRNEDGLSAEAIRDKRKKQLDGIRDYYVGLGWSSGPHLFIDERWIWLFTPMYDVGTHAKSGNSFTDANGKLHYSIGIETVGWFQHHGWPITMQRLLQIAVQSIRSKIGTYELLYASAPANRPDLHEHSISFHYDYNKPGCPGAIITPDYALPILKKPYPSVYLIYQVVAPCAVFQSRNPDGLLAAGPADGQTRLAPGETILIDDITDGWLHLASEIGFIPESYARPK